MNKNYIKLFIFQVDNFIFLYILELINEKKFLVLKKDILVIMF